MTTKQAFEHLTNQRAWYKLCNINPDVARSLKRNYKQDKISAQYVRKLLQSAGYIIVPEKWQAPKPPKADTK